MSDEAQGLAVLTKGACYQSTADLKQAVGQWYASDGRSFVASKNSGGKQKTYFCSGRTGGCKSQVRAYKGAEGVWKVHTVDAAHTNCSGGKTMGRTAALSVLAAQAVKDHGGINGVQLKRKLERDTGIAVTHRTTNRMKKTARDGDKASAADGYKLLGSFCTELQRQCPGSIAELQKNPDGTFKRVFVMLGRAAHVVAESPYKVLCVDAGHLKGDWNGMMLVATGMDADNRLMHVATGICDKENADNYSWFYRMMKNNAEMAEVLNSPKTTLFTDKHLSHEPAIRVHASKPVWRWCLRHVIRRLPEAPGSIVTGFLYHAARAPTLKKFMDIMDSNVKPFKPKVYDALVAPADKHGNPSKQQRELVKWTHHAGPPDTAIGSVVSSNAAEQNMAMVGLEGRKLPPFGMMEYILDKTAAHMAERAELRDGTSEKFTPHAAKEYEAQRKKSSNLHSSATGNCNFTVRKRGSQYGNRVRLEFGGTDGGVTLMSCTCGFTTRFKIPCCDIIAVGRVLNKSDEVMASIDPAYHLDTYRALYGDSRFEVQLPVLDELTVDPDILPPRWVPNQAGRPKGKGPQSTKRIPSRGEHASSSSYNVRLTPTPSTRAPALSQGAPAASQGAATLSQGEPVLSQGAPAPSQGGVQSSVVSID